jgi:uridine phosphorylase
MDPLQGNAHRPDPSELVLNPDGSVYHLGLAPGDIADRIILVGDPGRVELVSEHFERIETERRKREFFTRTGVYRGERFSVISTGIGTDNVDIVLTELDALASFDLQEGRPLQAPRSLTLVRLGTSGTLREGIPLESLLFSEMVIGMDGVMHAYQHRETEREERFRQAFEEEVPWPEAFARPYAVEADPELSRAFGELSRGITITAHGFYGLQGRSLRVPLAHPGLNESMRQFRMDGLQVSNFEMESSVLYGLASSLGHRACTLCLIIADRSSGHFSPDHERSMRASAKEVLERTRKG